MMMFKEHDFSFFIGLLVGVFGSGLIVALWHFFQPGVNSLDVLKILISLLIPISIFYASTNINRRQLQDTKAQDLVIKELDKIDIKNDIQAKLVRDYIDARKKHKGKETTILRGFGDLQRRIHRINERAPSMASSKRAVDSLDELVDSVTGHSSWGSRQNDGFAEPEQDEVEKLLSKFEANLSDMKFEALEKKSFEK
jgi:hypothetical protein